MTCSVRDGLQIALFLVSALLFNLRFLYQAADIKVWLTGAATGVVLACAVTLVTQITQRRRERHSM